MDSITLQYVNSDSGNKTITLTSDQSNQTNVTVTAKVQPTGDSTKYKVTITATIDSETKGKVMLYKYTVEVPNQHNLALTSGGNEITVNTGTAGGTKTATVAGQNEVTVNIKSVTLETKTYTYTYRTFYPDYGFYISKVKHSGTTNLWCTAWDGGECEYAEYYQRDTGALLVLYVRILGSLDIRYFGTTSTTWKIIETKDNFKTKLDLLRGTQDLSGLSTGDPPDAERNLVNGTANESYNTEYSKALVYEG